MAEALTSTADRPPVRQLDDEIHLQTVAVPVMEQPDRPQGRIQPGRLLDELVDRKGLYQLTAGGVGRRGQRVRRGVHQGGGQAGVDQMYLRAPLGAGSEVTRPRLQLVDQVGHLQMARIVGRGQYAAQAYFAVNVGDDQL